MVYGQLLAGGLPSLNGIFFLGAEELHFADQEKVRLDGSDVRLACHRQVRYPGLGFQPGFWLPSPPPPSLPLTALDFAYSLVQCKEGCDLLGLVI